ncbi:DUF1254 domain-containing protein [Prosthecomicrobium sp. N25]|uniref:DUF1254 domain-containing protein n=1 Tax=Prosthecomicrobium sp. N25 TaxID=3129254 RepID=UPI00307777FA
MTRVLYAILFGLVLGGVIHIVAVLGLPRVAENDAWARIAALGPDQAFNPIPRPGPGVDTLPLIDPAFAEFACRFRLDDNPVRIRATLPDLYWSIAVFNGRGVNAYNLNDRSVGQKPVDILIASQDQIADIRDNPPADFNDTIIVDWASARGFAIIRVFAPTPADTRDAELAIQKATCAPYPLG